MAVFHRDSDCRRHKKQKPIIFSRRQCMHQVSVAHMRVLMFAVLGDVALLCASLRRVVLGGEIGLLILVTRNGWYAM